MAIIFSYSLDRLIDGPSGKVIKDLHQGPAFFILSALKEHEIVPVMYSGNELTVEIKIYDGAEYGSVKEISVAKNFPFPDAETCLFSTILTEWNLEGMQNYNGNIFMDIQGYVRDGSDFGKKLIWENAGKYAPFIFCIKGNEHEMKFIAQEVLEEQKRNRMLIITLVVGV